MSSEYPPILDELGRGPPVRLRRVGGGCIADARVAVFADGSRVFVKTHENAAGMFECEAFGLRALAAADAIRVPEVFAVGRNALVLEMIDEGRKQPGFFESFGRSFARLHRCHGPQCGFPHDNYIGSTPQRNAPLSGSWEEDPPEAGKLGDGSCWPEFFLERRLRFQADLARERGHGAEPGRLLDRAEATIVEHLEAAPEPPCILHGDLWGGNYLVDEGGEACLIDPAAYYGHREADLAMTRLFGGFEPSFYSAYHESYPLAPGHAERLPMYQLYHVLNHLNLFGGAYYGQCVRILQLYS